MPACCSTFESAAAQQFNEKKAVEELRRYRTTGPGRTTRLLREGIAHTGALNGTLLDVGSGVGSSTCAADARRGCGLLMCTRVRIRGTEVDRRNERAEGPTQSHLGVGRLQCVRDVSRERCARVLDRLDIPPGTRLLDVACGANIATDGTTHVQAEYIEVIGTRTISRFVL